MIPDYLDMILGMNDDMISSMLNTYNVEPRELRLRAHFSRHQTLKFTELMTNASMKMMHYTKPENVINIAESNSIWLRHTRLMEDVSEIEYGYEALLKFIENDHASHMWSVLDKNAPDVSDRIKYYIKGHGETLLNQTYIFCLTQQNPKATEGIDLLYKDFGQVAVVICPEPMRKMSDELGANSYPVIYENRQSLIPMMNQIAQRISSQPEMLEGLNEEEILGHMWLSIVQLVFATKDAQYIAENEWRLVYNPVLNSSPHMVPVNNGCEEEPEAYALPLKNFSELGMNLEPKAIVEEVLIKKSDQSEGIKRKLIDANETLDLGFDTDIFKVI